MNKKEGSAILIAMLVISLVGVVGFGLSRLAIMQLRLASINDASLRAYHAAEAGLEYALYQYGINKDATISAASINTVVVPAQQGLGGQNNNPLVFNIPESDQSFEALMTHYVYLTGQINCQTNQVNEGNVRLATNAGGCEAEDAPLIKLNYDESITISKTANTELYLRAEPAQIPPKTDLATAERAIVYGAVEVTGFIGDTVLRHELFNLWSPNRDVIMSPTRSDAFHLPLFTNADQITIRYYKPTNGFDAGPLAVSLQLKDNATGQLIPFDSGVTTINIVGKVEGHTRRIKAQIDRRTDEVIGIFDYALYSQENLNQTDVP